MLNKKDMEIVSNNLHKNNVRIERDIRFSLLMKEPRQPKEVTLLCELVEIKDRIIWSYLFF